MENYNEESTTQDLRKALDLLRAGNSKAARPILVRLLKTHPELEQAWYMLSFTVQDSPKQIYALEQVLNLNPDNEKARARLAKISGDADLEAKEEMPADGPDLLSERMGTFGGTEETHEEPESTQPTTEEEKPSADVKNESELPTSKPTTQPKVKEKPITSPRDDYSFEEKPNRRRLIIVLLLIVVIVSGSAALYFGRNLFSSDVVSPSGDETATPFDDPTEEPTQRGVRQLNPTWTPTITPTPTLTPRPTSTQTQTSTSTPLPTIIPTITGVPET